ncbi:unnamed protein product [Callosobruchus maculatus]|uniref:Uncharacterized protein n=1 Tax=Callosobruchus maculatus TaxID=64391 RepID=A0A653D290_CALMS|nr:unnamed protein product [Callosobruchus maculatus]
MTQFSAKTVRDGRTEKPIAVSWRSGSTRRALSRDPKYFYDYCPSRPLRWIHNQSQCCDQKKYGDLNSKLQSSQEQVG